MLSPRTLIRQALTLIEQAILLHETNHHLYEQARYASWCKQEIKKTSLQLVSQILKNSYLGSEKGPVLPELSRAVPARSNQSESIGSIRLADHRSKPVAQIHGAGCGDCARSSTQAAGPACEDKSCPISILLRRKMESIEPLSKPRQRDTVYHNRNQVQAKLDDALYLALYKYCAKEKLNINSFLKITIAYYLKNHG